MLDAAEREDFEIAVTTDTVFRNQQNLSGRRIAIVCLFSTSWPGTRRIGTANADAIASFELVAYVDVRIS